MKKILALILFLSVSIALIACNKEQDVTGEENNARSRTISTFYFNTFSAVYTYGDKDDAAIEKYKSIAEEELKCYHELFDIYYEYAGVNNIKTINRNAGKSPIKVDGKLVEFLQYCKELYTLTNGKTNIMLGSVLGIWHDARDEASADFGYLSSEKLPTEQELSLAAEHTSIDLLVINEEDSTVYISDPKASIDVGAIAKGYTVDKIVNRLKSEGANSVALNIGGNIRTIGLKPGDKPWVTGITNPDKDAENSIKCKVEMGDCSLVTSGDYERYFYVGDKKYHHIIDPDTLMPAEYFASISIVTKDSGFADALSTALFCMSYEEGIDFVKSLEGVDVIWIFKDGRLEHTEGITFAN